MPEKDRDPNNHNLPKDLQEALKFLVDKYEHEDSWVRKQQIKLWKKNEEFWHGLQFIFWSESKQDWMAPVGTSGLRWYSEDEGREGVEGPFYDFVINIYQAHGEAIISALSSQTPVVRFPPDDAEDDDDIRTSKTYGKIADLIMRHNQVKLLQLMSLFMLWNQGICAWYHAPKADKAFGVTKIENYKKVLSCSQCEKQTPVDDEEDLIDHLHKCPDCGGDMEVGTALDGEQQSPKSRVIIDVFGGMHVKVPFWARVQGDFSYIIKALDQPNPFLKSIYPHIADQIGISSEDAQTFERMARTPSTFNSFSRADDNRDLGTHKQVWLRTWAFEGLPKEKDAVKKRLYERFPNGVYVAFVGTTYAESRDEDMDKHWTIAKAKLSTYIHADAMGQALISPQELRNVLTNLTTETIEQGIGSMFADPDVLNFDVYSKHEARPGMVYPARPRPGKTLNESFFEGGRATLSREVAPFQQQLDKDAQFTVGSFPSLYGGPGEGKSRTLGEYQQSRQQALQRLQIAWILFVIYWSKLIEKCVHLYVENMIEDERFTTKDPSNKENYVNVWIKQADLTGHVGEVEPEGADSFPFSMPQKQALFFKLLELNNDFINAALFDPMNRRMVADLTGFTDLEIPGEDQRVKQAVEIVKMMKGLPVAVDPIVDDHEVHLSTGKAFMVGPKGMDLRDSSPDIYMLIEQHLQQHAQLIQQNQQQNLQSQLDAKEAAKMVGKVTSDGGSNGSNNNTVR
jgi:hypothetical protein